MQHLEPDDFRARLAQALAPNLCNQKVSLADFEKARLSPEFAALRAFLAKGE